MTRIELRADGPHSDDYTADLADALFQVIRTLNHATGPHADAGLTYPSTAYTIVGNLAAGIGGLQQLLEQLGAFLDREAAAGRLGDDREPDRDPAAALASAHNHLAAARYDAADLSNALGSAQVTLSGLYIRSTTEGDDR